MIETVAIVVLGLVIVAQAVDKQIYTKAMLRQMDDLIKAAKSPTINDYMAAKAADNPNNAKQAEPEEILLENADDAVFDKFINSQTQ